MEDKHNGCPYNHQETEVIFGTSYYYRTEIAFSGSGDASFQTPAELNVLFDGVGKWHGTLLPPSKRYNTLHGDGHVKNITFDRMMELWSMRL